MVYGESNQTRTQTAPRESRLPALDSPLSAAPARAGAEVKTMATVRMTYTLDHLADTQAREVSRARALAWVARGWRNEKQVLAEVEANARAAENHTAILRGMFVSLTVQAGS